MKILVAGVGNVLLSDDGFGVEVVRELRGALPAGVEVVDTGIRGMHLAYQLLDGYDVLVIVDAVQRGGDPGTLHVLEHELDAPAPETGGPVLDAHGMDPAAVLTLLAGLAGGVGVERPVGRVLVVGCEPAVVTDGMGLSPAVATAVEPAARAVTALVTELIAQVQEEGVRS